MARTFQEMRALEQAQIEEAQNRGLLGNIWAGFKQPIQRALEAAQYARSEPGSYTPLFKGSTAQDINSAIQDPTRNVLKTVSGVGSLAVGGGGGNASTVLGRIATAGARSGLGGAMAGFGASEKENELESTLRGGLTGLIAGSTIQGIGEGANTLRNFSASKAAERASQAKGLGTNVAEEVTDSPLLTTLKEQRAGLGVKGSSVDDILPISDRNIRKLGLSPSESVNLRNELIGDMSSAGLDTSSATNLSNSYRNYISSLADEKANLLSQVGGDIVDSGSVSKGFKKMADILGDSGSDVKLINDRLSEIFGGKTTVKTVPKAMTKAQVVAVKELADDVAGGFEKVMAADTTTQVSKKLLSAIRNASRDVVSGDELLDDYLQKASRAAKLRDVVIEAPNIAAKVSDRATSGLGRLDQQIAKEQMRMANEARLLADANDIGIKIPFTDTAIPTGIDRTNIGGSIQGGGLGRAISNVGNFAGKVGNRVLGATEAALPVMSQIAPTISGITSQPTGGNDTANSLTDTYSQSPLAGMTKMDLLNWALAQTGGDLSTALTIAKYLEDDLVGGLGEATPQNSALAAVQQLRELYGRGDASNVGGSGDLSLGFGAKILKPLGKARGGLREMFDSGFANDLQIFTNQAQQILGLITQALGSGAPQEAEAKRLMESIPNASTSNETATAWFNNMEKLINSVSGGTQFSTTDDSSQF